MLVTVISMIPTDAVAEIIHVPADSSTIQAGINGTMDGDTVMVADGTYTGDGNRDIEIFGKTVVVMSENGPENCIINCEGSQQDPHRGFYIHDWVGPETVIMGFTIQNGWLGEYDDGGAIYCHYYASPSIEDNIIMNNHAYFGGGIYCHYGSDAIISENVFMGNTASDGGAITCGDNSSSLITDNIIVDNHTYSRAGGIYCYDDSDAMITDNTITDNSSEDGGGLYIIGAYPTIRGNTISRNSAGLGGGIFCFTGYGVFLITENLIKANTALRRGGGIYSKWSWASIVANIITSNTADYGGGGIYHQEGSMSSVENNLIAGNSGGYGGGILCNYRVSITISGNIISGNTGTSGGGIGCYDSSPTLIDNDIVLNTAVENGGGIYCWEDSHPTIENNVIAGNTAGTGGGLYFHFNSSPLVSQSTITANRASSAGGIYVAGYSFPTVMHSIVWGDSSGSGEEISVNDSSVIDITYSDVENGFPGDGNFGADPLFVLPGRRDYRLLWGSPCIDSGHPDSLDIDGSRRDVGVHSFDQNDDITLYLTPSATTLPQEGSLEITYTVINRWPYSMDILLESGVICPGGFELGVHEPIQVTIPAGFTAQSHMIHEIPETAVLGQYDYWSTVGILRHPYSDQDRFTFTVVENPLKHLVPGFP